MECLHWALGTGHGARGTGLVLEWMETRAPTGRYLTYSGNDFNHVQLSSSMEDPVGSKQQAREGSPSAALNRYEGEHGNRNKVMAVKRDQTRYQVGSRRGTWKSK